MSHSNTSDVNRTLEHVANSRRARAGNTFLGALESLLNVPILLAHLSGISIYWASPIYQHSQIRIRETSMWRGYRNLDIAQCPTAHTNPPDGIYNHMSLGPGIWIGSAPALVLPYLFMLKDGVRCRWSAGEAALLATRRTDLLTRSGCFDTTRFSFRQTGAPPMPIPFSTQVQPLQRAAYSPFGRWVLRCYGWAIHKPMQLHCWQRFLEG